MKKTLTILIIAAVIIGGYLVLNKNGSGIDVPIKIGATLPLTGSLASIGASDVNGLILAAEEINANGGVDGRKFEIISEDNRGDAKEAVSNSQKLLNVDNVDVIFSAFTHITKAIAPVVKEKSIPLFYSSTDGTIASESDVFFRDYFDAEQAGIALFKKVQSDGQKNFKVISEQNDACVIFVEAFKKEAKNSDVVVGEETYFQATETDFRSHLTKLNIQKDNALLVCAFRHSHLVMKSLSDLGLIGNQTYHLVAPFLPASNDPAFRELYSKNKTVSTWYGFAETGQTEKQEEYIKKYKERFNQDPVADSAYLYDDLYILSDVLKECMKEEGIDNQCFKDEMAKVDYTGVTGRVNFDTDGRSNRETLIIQAENNEWKTIK